MAIKRVGTITAKPIAPPGNERIQQLMEQFPEMPRTLVVKADLLREGVRPNDATRQAGRWALPYAPWYFDYEKENCHTPETATEGYMLTPVTCYFPDGVCYQFMSNSKSPYEVRYEGGGRYWLYRDEDAIEEVFFPARPKWYDRKTSSGKPMPSVMSLRAEDWLMLAALVYCEYGKDNLQCKYCNINLSETTNKNLGMHRLTAKRDQDVYETFVTACQESDASRLMMSGGVMLDPNKEADNYARLAKVVSRASKDLGHRCTIGVNMQATPPEAHMTMKEAGISTCTHSLEVWDSKLFETICPGKAKYVGRQRWMERLLHAREIFGRGHAGSLFVVGLELAHPEGFKTEDEAAESYLAGVEWLLSQGMYCGGAPVRFLPGTALAGLRPPRTEYYLRLELARYKMSVKYEMVPKPGSRPPGDGVTIVRDLLHMGLQRVPGSGPQAGRTAPQAC